MWIENEIICKLNVNYVICRMGEYFFDIDFMFVLCLWWFGLICFGVIILC